MRVQRAVGALCVVWALGTILYELICGHPPFDEPTIFALCAQVCTKEPAPGLPQADDVPAELAELINAGQGEVLAEELGTGPLKEVSPPAALAGGGDGLTPGVSPSVGRDDGQRGMACGETS